MEAGGSSSSARPGVQRSFLAVMAALLIAGAVLAVVRWPDHAHPADASGPTGPGAVAGASAHAAQDSLPNCNFDANLALQADYSDWQSTLVDTTQRLPKSYAPPDLAPVTDAGFASPTEIRSLVIADLTALRQAASAAGAPLGIVAAYRSFADQRSLFHEREAQLGSTAALNHVALPGHSEHQLGTAIDFTSAGLADVDQSWAKSRAGQWMAANAWRFGFVLSYPKGQTERTCYAFEPWHYRYFGRDVAAKIHASGLTTREYLWRQANNLPIPVSS